MLGVFSLKMTKLQRERKIRVYSPSSYNESDKRYPVVYMHDGQNLFVDSDAAFGTSWGLKDFLDQSGMELIVVGIDNGEERLDEYAPWPNRTVGKEMLNKNRVYGGEGDLYVDFIVNELKPFIDHKYRTNPNQTAMIGSSMGALISTYAACKYPHIFKRIAALSSAFWFNQKEIESLIEESDLSALEKFYLDFGTQEVDDEVRNQRLIESSQIVFEKLKGKVKVSSFFVVEGGEHNEKAWKKRIPEIFEYLFG